MSAKVEIRGLHSLRLDFLTGREKGVASSVVVLSPEVQDLYNRGTFAMLLLAHRVPGLHLLQLR